ncbi:SRPBCC family protein [Streptomyces wuyuanensis]|uniref:Carbon monoxide dehydrogenase subunit G n=1 Tax=Streptomyces wuyuanensis TaxID=1196353 RepID=A0A1G9S580_9ACTN|nr:SRPBCC domain-containing protein [Streptomyces wuyuanensis]SDM30636.1 Carbon monoxide dehydrogenase subunit G [Streptomyces wuyuanensis]
MEHEVFVPVPADSLRRTLADPARVARCVPGLQRDADASAGPLGGRLKVRVGGHTITYRGALRITETDGGFSVEGEGTEARGHGSAKLALTVRITEAEGGATLGFTGTAHADGRLADAAPGTAEQAARRLLDRFASSLEAAAGEEGRAAAGDTGSGAGPEDPGSGSAAGAAPAQDSGVAEPTDADTGTDSAKGADADAAATGAGTASRTPGGDASAAPADGSGAREDAVEDDEDASLFDVDVPPPSLDPLADEVFGEDDEPPAEAAHARRTMIGRSAEEVDHAPPRGRYAPVPAPQPATAGSTLRWAAPAAALAIASAVVVGRALRRRR